MQSAVKNVPLELARARSTLERLRRRVSTVRIAADTGIHQSQVSRLVRGHFRRLSPNVRTLLAYAEKPAARKDARGEGEAAKAAVIKAALRTWDATPAGAQALVRLLRSVEQLRRGARSR
ncbi:MAG: hypothetical protein ABR570_07405 [Burkholderiales bacterium]